MTEESILIEKPAKETASLAKKIISEIYGTVTKEEAQRIDWEYEIGVHTIECESHIEPHPGHTVITTSAHSETRKSSSKRVIDKFHKALLKDLKKRKNRKSDKKKVEPEESKVNSIIKSISPKHIVIGSVTLIVGTLSYLQFRRR